VAHETHRETIGRLARRQAVSNAYRTYAVLVLEHERLRRARWRGELRATWEPDPAAWGTLRFLASVHSASSHSTQTLLELFEAHPRDEPVRVPSQLWREAVRAGIDLAADVLVAQGADLPWGRGRPRAPRNRAEFESACRFLRDLPPEAERPPLSALLEAARLPALPHKERAPGHRVTFYRGRQVLSVDGARIALPAGRELLFLEMLVERRGTGRVTPTQEHGINWRSVADNLSRRIRRVAGKSAVRAVVLSARGPVGGYRLAPGVRVRRD